MKVRYTVVDGEVIAEKRNGVRRQYVPDPLGSTVALLNQSGEITDTFSYWPYGESSSRDGSTPTPLQFVGSLGYYCDSSSRTYVRARHYRQMHGRWTTVDPLGFMAGWNRFEYAGGSPQALVDPSGLMASCVPSPCADILKQYLGNIPQEVWAEVQQCLKKVNPKEIQKCIEEVVKKKKKKIGNDLGDKFWEYIACLIGSRMGGYPTTDPRNPCGPLVTDCIACCGGCHYACLARCAIECGRWWDPFGIKCALCISKCKKHLELCLATCDETSPDNPCVRPI